MNKISLILSIILLFLSACSGAEDVIEPEKEKVPGPSSLEKVINNLKWKRAEIIHGSDTRLWLYSYNEDEKDALKEKYALNIKGLTQIKSRSGTYTVSAFQIYKYINNEVEFVILPNYSVQEKYGDYGYLTLTMTGDKQANISIYLKNLEDENLDYIDSYTTNYEGRLDEGTILVY